MPSSNNFDKELRKDLIKYEISKSKDIPESEKVLNILNISTSEITFKDIDSSTDPEINRIIEKHNKSNTLTILYVFLVIFFPLIFQKYLNYSLNYHKNKSFILVNKTSEKSYENHKDSKNKLTYFGFTFITATIFLSILSNILSKLIERFIF